VVVCAWRRSGTVLKCPLCAVVVEGEDAFAGAVGSTTAAPEIEGWTTTGGVLVDEEELPMVGPGVDGTLTDELDDEEDRAMGAGSGLGLPDCVGAACGAGSGFGDACARLGIARANPKMPSTSIPAVRETMVAAISARAIRVSEPPCRVRQLSRARTSPSQL
jgi:hypothetical protein